MNSRSVTGKNTGLLKLRGKTGTHSSLAVLIERGTPAPRRDGPHHPTLATRTGDITRRNPMGTASHPRALQLGSRARVTPGHSDKAGSQTGTYNGRLPIQLRARRRVSRHGISQEAAESLRVRRFLDTGLMLWRDHNRAPPPDSTQEAREDRTTGNHALSHSGTEVQQNVIIAGDKGI